MNCFLINLNYTLKVSLLSKEHLIPPRTHITRIAPTYILYFITAGTLSIKLNGKDFTLNKGDIYIFKKGDFHAPSQNTDCEYFYLHFDADINELDISEQELLCRIKERNHSILSYEMLDVKKYDHFIAHIPQKIHISDNEIFDYLVGEFKKSRLHVWDVGMERRMEISAAATSILLKLERIVLNEYLSQTNNGYSQNFALVNQISSFVEKNYTSDICADDIERMFSISYDHANRLFKRHKGMSIIAYRNHLRIEKAKVLLLTTEKSVTVIAEETGFEDKYYFSKFFKKAVGSSPTQFKRGECFAL